MVENFVPIESLSTVFDNNFHRSSTSHTNDKAINSSNSEMDDGGRCLLDVINDPQLLQSFLENSSNNNNNPQPQPSQQSTITTPITTSSSTASTASVAGGSSNVVISQPPPSQLAPPPQITSPPILPISTPIVTPILTPSNVVTSTTTSSQIVLPNAASFPVVSTTSAIVATTTTTAAIPATPTTTSTTTGKKTVRARKSAVAPRTPKASKQQQQQQPTQFVHHSTISTPTAAGAPNTLTAVTGPNGTPTAFQIGPGGTLIPLSIAGAHQNLLAGQQIRTTGPTGTAPTQFLPTQFQLGPRPQMTVLPQQILQLPPTGSGGQPQFLITRPQLNHPPTAGAQPQFAAGPGGQLLQIIQTSQGPQIVQTTPTLSGQPSAILPTASAASVTSMTNTTTTPTTKGSKKQLLPKAGSAKNQSNKGNNSITNTSTTNLMSTPTNIKLVQQAPGTPTSFVGQTTFHTASNIHNQTHTPTQFLLGGASTHQTQPQPAGQLIAGPNGTTFFVHNNAALASTPGGPQILLQPGTNQPLQLAIRPPTPGPNVVVSQAGGLMAFPANTIRPATAPGQPPGQLIIRPPTQMIGQQGQVATPAPQQQAQPPAQHPPQFIQIQTPNGPILLSLNVNQNANQNNTNQTQPAAQPVATSQPQPTPQTIQIGNTVIQLAANGKLAPGPPQQQTTTVTPNSTTHHHQLPTTILTAHHPHAASNLNASNSIQPIVSSSPLIINQQQQQFTALTGQATPVPTAALVSPKTTPKTSTTGKGLNLADLLKETGILPSDFSPPNSPPPPSTTVLASPLSKNTFDNSSSTQVLLDPNLPQQQQQHQQPPQQAILMVQQPGGGTNQILLAPPPNATGTIQQAIPSPTPTSAPQTQQPQAQQLRISLAPDGTIVFMSPSGQTSNSFLSANNTSITTNKTAAAGGSGGSSVARQNLVDSSGLGSSQPSPDSTTPSIDAQTGSPCSQTSQAIEDKSNKANNVLLSPVAPILSKSDIDVPQQSFITTTTTTTILSSINTTSLSDSKLLSTPTTTTNSVIAPVVQPIITSQNSSSNCSTDNSYSAGVSHPISSIATPKPSVASPAPSVPSVPHAPSTLPPNADNNTPQLTGPMVLIPGTIIFLNVNENNNSRIQTVAATLSRKMLPELLQKLEQQLKPLIQVKQPSAQQKELILELMQLQQNISLIQQQQLPLNQIPQVKISQQAQQLLQLNSMSLSATNTLTVVNTTTTTATNIIKPAMPLQTSSCQPVNAIPQQSPQPPPPQQQTILVTASSNTTTTTMTTTATTLTAQQQSQPIQIVLPSNTTQNINSQQAQPATIQLVTNASPAAATLISPNKTQTNITNQKVVTDGSTSQQSTPTLIIPKPKSNVVKAIQSQLHADQNTALNPDFRTPFRSRDDACKRLLRYHVFDQQLFTKKELRKFDKVYENVAQMLLEAKDKLFNKFRYLILKNSMKPAPSSEYVMVNRIIIDDETAALKSDKEFVASGGVLDLPPIPESWIQMEKERQQQHDTSEADQLAKELENQLEQLHSEPMLDGLLLNEGDNSENNNSMKRKYDEADIDEINFATSQLMPAQDKLQHEDLNDMLSDMFNDQQDTKMACMDSINQIQNNNQSDDQNEDSNNVVDELIKQLDSPTPINGNFGEFLSEQFSADSSSNNRQSLSDGYMVDSANVTNSATSNLEDDLALEALYSSCNINNNTANNDDCFHNNNHHSDMLSWSSSNHQDHQHISHHNHHLIGASSSTNSWTSSRHHFGSINETEAAVAVQSIIGGDDDDDSHHNQQQHNPFGSIITNHQNDNTTFDDDFGGDNIINDQDDSSQHHQTSDMIINNNSNSDVDQLQMNCAIKSIMMSSQQQANYQNVTNQSSNHHHDSDGTMNNDNSLSYHQQTSNTYHDEFHSLNTMSHDDDNNNFHNEMMMFSHQTSSTTTSSTSTMINDPMLDEAVKSIL